MKVVKDSGLSLLEVTGPDAIRYLHGRTSADIQRLPENGICSGLLLSPQGKVQGKFHLVKTASKLFILSEGKNTTQFTEDLFRFKVADQIDVEEVTGSGCYALLGDDLDCKSVTGLENGLFLVNPGRLDEPYCLVFGEKKALDEFCLEYEEAPLTELRKFCITSKEPVFGFEIKENTMATDLPLEGLVSTTKGCYAGQEVIERASAIGRANKKLVYLESTSSFEEGQKLLQDENKVGSVASALEISGPKWIGLGFIKASVDESLGLEFG